MADIVKIVEDSRDLANKAICSSLNDVFTENKIELKVSGEISENSLALKILGLKNEYEAKSLKEII